MSHIKPFKAVYYNTSKIKDLAKVVSPPYDIISPEDQGYLHNLSPYNFTHIDFGKDESSDDKTNNKYTRAKKIFTDWLDKNILLKDDRPCIYFYKQDYNILGEKHSRMGFVSLLELEDEEDSRVLPHENTHSDAIDDRLKLCESVKSNLSSIFVCYSDKHRRVEKIFNKYVLTSKPLLKVMDNDRVNHTLWRLDNPDPIKRIDESLSGQQLFIADGHHRYKVALDYRNKRLSRITSPSGQEPFNYVMTYFTNIESKGLKIFPVHRIVKHLPGDMTFLEEFFRIDKIKRKEDLTIVLAKAGRNEHAFVLYTRDGIKLLRLKNKLLIDKYVKNGSKEYKTLDATILKSFVFDRIKIKSEDIIYTKDIKQVIHIVDEAQADAGFIMNPVTISELKAIALNSERMPPKTTYFYPKVLSGLTVYKME
jgi:uncharacterized protein (DUF1015 family)